MMKDGSLERCVVEGERWLLEICVVEGDGFHASKPFRWTLGNVDKFGILLSSDCMVFPSTGPPKIIWMVH